jgi:alanine racemase
VQDDPDAARLIVDLDALAANFAHLRALSGHAETAPVVKADAYGLGVGPVARRLWAEGARSFFVARVSEGEALRRLLPDGGSGARIYVLDGCTAGAGPRLEAAELIPVLNSLPQIEEWAAHARGRRRRLAAALHIDTGLNRLGLRLDEAQGLAQARDRLQDLALELVISHLACGEDADNPMNARQAATFAEAAALFPGARRSLANSAGVLLGDGYRQDLTRPGVALYGGGPLGRPDPAFRAVATLEAPILQVRNVRPGESVGYGATYTADEPLRIAVIAAGYADGVLRAGSPRGYGWLNGAACAFVGRISMDLIALDVTSCEATPGDRVELFGLNRALDEAAAAAGSIAYELLTRVGPRVARQYVGLTA